MQVSFGQMVMSEPMKPVLRQSSPARPSVASQNLAISGNNVYVSWVDTDQNNTRHLHLQRSTDGGKTFEDQVILANITGIDEPKIAAVGNEVYIAWADTTSDHSSLFVKKSIDDGLTFGDPISINIKDARLASLADIAVSDNLVQIIWTGTFGQSRTQSVMLSQSTNGAATFEAPVYLSKKSESSSSPQVVHSGVNTYVLWSSNHNCQPMLQVCTISHYLRTINDGTVGATNDLTSLDGNLQIQLAADGNTVVVEGLERNYQDNFFENSTIIISLSTNGGNSFSTSKSMYHVNMDNIYPVVLGQELYQFWTLYEDGHPPNPIFFEKSSDLGKTFAAPVDLSGDLIPPGGANLSSQVAHSGKDVYVVWEGNDKSGADHLYLGTVGPDSNVKVRPIEDVSRAGRFHVISQDSTVYLSYIVGGNLLFEKVDSSRYSKTDISCTQDPSPAIGSVDLGKPDTMISGEPATSVLAGWRTAIQSNLKNAGDRDLNISYNVQISRDGDPVWKSSDDLTILCYQTSRPALYWSPDTAGNYTIETSVQSQTEPSQTISSSNGTIQVFANPDLGTFSSLPPLKFKVLNDTDKIPQQGNSTLLIQAGPSSPNYKLSTISLSIAGTQGINAWFDRYSIFLPQNRPENLTMFVYADSSSRPGLNPLKIEGKGYVTNLVTGKMSSIGNPVSGPAYPMPPTKRIISEQGGYQDMGTVNLSVVQSGVQYPYATIGLPIYHPVQICSAPSPKFNGISCSGFIGYEEFPVTVYSKKNQQVSLTASNKPSSAWIKFQPSDLVATPQGTSAKMIVAGTVKPFMINPIGTDVMHINVNSTAGLSTTYIPLTKSGQQISVINSTGPIDLGSALANINNATPDSFGLVYDSNQGTTLPVSLSVLGIKQDNKTVEMPSWLSVKFEPSSFLLNSSQPFYFKIETATFSPPAGSHSTVVIGEKIGEKNYTEDLQVNIPNPVRMGGMPAMASAMSPVAGSASAHTPLEQFKAGVSIDKIKCANGLELMEKKDDHSPACVKSHDAQILKERGWGSFRD